MIPINKFISTSIIPPTPGNKTAQPEPNLPTKTGDQSDASSDTIELKNAEQEQKAKQIVDFHQRRANLLRPQSGKSDIAQDQAQKKDCQYEKELGQSKDHHLYKEPQKICNISYAILENSVISAADLVSTAVEIDSKAYMGLSLGLGVGNELKGGAFYLAGEIELRNLKAKLRVVNQEIQAILTNDPENNGIGFLRAEKSHLEDQISKQKSVVLKEGLSFLGTHIMNTISAVLMVLGNSTALSATYTAAGGGLAMGVIGAGVAAVGVACSAKALAAVNDQVGALGRVSVEHENGNVSAALENYNLASIAHTAGHQKGNAILAIFQNSFSFGSSLAGIAASIIGIVALAGGAVSAGAISATGIGLPVLGAVGLLIVAGVMIYNNRHSIRRGLQGLFEKRDEGKMSSINPLRNLKVREWYTKFKLQRSIEKIENLSFERAALSSMERTAIKISSIDEQMLKKAYKIVRLSGEMEDIHYKRAFQSLKDKTSSLEAAKKDAIEANSKALIAVNAELEELTKNIKRLNDPDEKKAHEVYLELKADKIEKGKQLLEEFKSRQERIADPMTKEERENLFDQMSSRKIGEWSEILAKARKIMKDVINPNDIEVLKKQFSKYYEKEIDKIEAQFLVLAPDQRDEKMELEAKRKKFLSYVDKPMKGIEANRDGLKANINILIKSFEDLDNPDVMENKIAKLEVEFKKKAAALIEEKERLTRKAAIKDPTRMDNTNIKTMPLQSEEEAKTVAKALEESIMNLESEELLKYVKVSKDKGIKFDDLLKYQTHEQKQRYVIRESIKAILYPN